MRVSPSLCASLLLLLVPSALRAEPSPTAASGETTLDPAHWTILLSSPDPWLTAMGGSTAQAARANISAITVQGRVVGDNAILDASRNGWDLRHTTTRRWLQTMTRTTPQTDCAERTRLLATLLGVEFFDEALSWVFSPLRLVAQSPADDTPLGVWEREAAAPAWMWPPAPEATLDRFSTQHARLLAWDDTRGAVVRSCVDIYPCGAAHGSLTCSVWRLDGRTGASDAYEVSPATVVAADFLPVPTAEGGDNEHRASLPIRPEDDWNWIRTIWEDDGAPRLEAQVSWDSCYACSSSAWTSYTATQRARTASWPAWAGDAPPSLPAPLAATIMERYPQHVIVGVIPPR